MLKDMEKSRQLYLLITLGPFYVTMKNITEKTNYSQQKHIQLVVLEAAMSKNRVSADSNGLLTVYNILFII